LKRRRFLREIVRRFTDGIYIPAGNENQSFEYGPRSYDRYIAPGWKRTRVRIRRKFDSYVRPRVPMVRVAALVLLLIDFAGRFIWRPGERRLRANRMSSVAVFFVSPPRFVSPGDGGPASLGFAFHSKPQHRAVELYGRGSSNRRRGVRSRRRIRPNNSVAVAARYTSERPCMPRLCRRCKSSEDKPTASPNPHRQRLLQWSKQSNHDTERITAFPFRTGESNRKQNDARSQSLENPIRLLEQIEQQEEQQTKEAARPNPNEQDREAKSPSNRIPKKVKIRGKANRKKVTHAAKELRAPRNPSSPIRVKKGTEPDSSHPIRQTEADGGNRDPQSDAGSEFPESRVESETLGADDNRNPPPDDAARVVE